MMNSKISSVMAFAKEGLKRVQNMPPLVAFVRAGEIAAYVALDCCDRDKMLFFADLGGFGFQPDEIIAVMDSFHSNIRNPLTGRRWKPGEMQTAFEAGVSGVAECLTLTAADRLGCTAFVTPYTRTKDGVTCAETVEHGVTNGLVPDGLLDALRSPLSIAVPPQHRNDFRRFFDSVVYGESRRLSAMNRPHDPRVARDWATCRLLAVQRALVMLRNERGFEWPVGFRN